LAVPGKHIAVADPAHGLAVDGEHRKTQDQS
jgi:hypothetical protein